MNRTAARQPRSPGCARLILVSFLLFALGMALRVASRLSFATSQVHVPTVVRDLTVQQNFLTREAIAAPHKQVPPSTKLVAVEEEGSRWNASAPLSWLARSLYLPISAQARAAFMRNEEKQRLRVETDGSIKALWASFDIKHCLEEVPECEFWKVIGAQVVFRKCCVEHMKLKRSLFHALDVADRAGLQLFLDSGTLLSAIRDGGNTLVPWETDIDLGVVGVDPALVIAPFAKFGKEFRSGSPGRREPHTHHFSPCATKESKNASRHGMCRDAHYVYYASNEAEARVDTSRVEIWPFWPEGDKLIHPTRRKLTVNRSLVEPLVFGGRCRMWGRPCACPRDPEGYLDHEYTPDWRVPKTIHWGKSNVPSWKPFTRRPAV